MENLFVGMEIKQVVVMLLRLDLVMCSPAKYKVLHEN